MSETSHGGERAFIKEQIADIANKSLEVLGPLYLDDQWESLRGSLRYEIVDPNNERGNVVPTVKWSSKDSAFILEIEPETILNFSEEISDMAGDEVMTSDVTRLLVGAGVARCILAWKTLPIGLVGDEKTKRHYQDLLCQGEPVWSAASKFDEENGTNLQMAVERLGDKRMPRVNVLRFCIGASLTHLSNVVNLQIVIPTHMQQELLIQEQARARELSIASAILDRENAFELYDDAVPDMLIAFSFPMSPAEELSSFATQRPD